MEQIKRHIGKDERGCWIWRGTFARKQPIVRVSQPKRRLAPARRIAYERFNEVSVPTSCVVANVCGVPACVNPAHHTAVPRGKHSHRQFGMMNRPEYCQRGHEFSPWNTGRRAEKRFCIACEKQRSRLNMARYRAKHPERLRRVRVDRIETKRDWVNQRKLACIRCLEDDPVCLDFHHREPSKKDTTISVAIRTFSLKRIGAEMSKCDVLCSNCHRKLHWEARQRGGVDNA
jgi:hypothetical protein